jgi:membrane-bound lytic murein transglycosylase A
MALQPVAFSDLSGWASDRPAAALVAFVASCDRIQYFPPDQSLGGSGEAARLGGKAAEWGPVCAAAKDVPPADDAAARSFFQTRFQPYRVTQLGRATATVTGYFEPEVAGDTSQEGPYQTPLLGLPPDLVTFDLGRFDPSQPGVIAVGQLRGQTVMPYDDRFAIENGAYFLQVEGSGRITLPDGSLMRVTYAGKNGRPYVPIGRVMVKEGLLAADDVTEQSIRAWLEAHPDRARAIMDQNPSYVFFRTAPELSDRQGPPGALGVSLTPGRSIAVDDRYVPLGAPVWLVTTDPGSHDALRRLTVAQDLGSAITGPLRADLFFGSGKAAEAAAGAMDAAGELYVLLPLPAAVASPTS